MGTGIVIIGAFILAMKLEHIPFKDCWDTDKEEQKKTQSAGTD